MITSMARPDSRMVGQQISPLSRVYRHPAAPDRSPSCGSLIISPALTERRRAPAATKAGNLATYRRFSSGNHGIIVNNKTFITQVSFYYPGEMNKNG